MKHACMLVVIAQILLVGSALGADVPRHYRLRPATGPLAVDAPVAGGTNLHLNQDHLATSTR